MVKRRLERGRPGGKASPGERKTWLNVASRAEDLVVKLRLERGRPGGKASPGERKT